ncbi:MAG: aminotransferase class V-fold PLP-dependent enzyme [Pseudomonadota bacterium]
MTPDLENARGLFDIPRETAYLNAAQMGPLPTVARIAGETAYGRKARPWLRTVQEDFFDTPEALRGLGAGLFGATPDDVAIIPAVSYGLAVAARNIQLQPGQDILVLDEQFPSNVYTWRRMAEREEARLVTVARRDGQSWTEALLGSIGPRTGLIACGALHWIDGGRVDLVAIGAAARAHGAKIVLDLTQSLGVMEFDIAECDPEFAAAAGYKWMLGPYTLGLLYAAPRWRDGEPLEENWINRERSEDFTRLIDYRDGYQPGARRFDMGERSNFQLIPSLIVSLKLLAGFGAPAIAAHLAETSAAIADAVKPLGLLADTPDRAPHYLALTLPHSAPSDLVARLRARDVHVSQRGRRLRVGAHIYNDLTDVERFVEAVRAELT